MLTLLEDREGNLWMSCNKGIFRVNKQEIDDLDNGKIVDSLQCISYGKAEGMKNSECSGGSQQAGWKTREGKLWFPTVKEAVINCAFKKNINMTPSDFKREQNSILESG